MTRVVSIKKACDLTDKAYFFALRNIKLGITELELRRDIVRFIHSNGGKLAFRPIVAFGKNASEVHHKPNNTRLKKNHGFIMIDVGAKVQGYCSDMTRTVFLGKVSKKQKKIYQTVLKAQQKSIEFVRTDVKAFDVDRISREYILRQKFPNIPHSVGHGVGKRVHESPKIGPKSKTRITDQMIFTIEPGIYIKNFGGVRIEDVYYLNRGKVEQLTRSPKQLIQLIK